MPITKSSTVTHTLMSINLDMSAMVMTVGFTKHIDGVFESNVSFQITGVDLGTLFATQAAAGQALSDEITVAIYNYAVSSGKISGDVV